MLGRQDPGLWVGGRFLQVYRVKWRGWGDFLRPFFFYNCLIDFLVVE